MTKYGDGVEPLSSVADLRSVAEVDMAPKYKGPSDKDDQNSGSGIKEM